MMGSMDAENLIVRAATAADIGFLSEMLVAAAAASGVDVPLDRLSAYPQTYSYVERFPSGSDVGIIAHTVDGRPVGAAWVRMLPTDAHAINEPLPELTMGVIPEYRRRGVGERLLTELYRAAAAKGIAKIALGVHTENLPAINLYHKQGWIQDGMFQEYLMMSRENEL